MPLSCEIFGSHTPCYSKIEQQGSDRCQSRRVDRLHHEHETYRLQGRKVAGSTKTGTYRAATYSKGRKDGDQKDSGCLPHPPTLSYMASM